MNPREHQSDRDYEAIVIGAGAGGIGALYKLRQLGMKTRLFEAGTGVGGAWYWNRYPGARVDSESYSYGFSFSQEVLREWNWSEHFAGQQEVERYFNFVVDRLNLRQYMQFSSRVAAAKFQEESGLWELELADGTRHRARFVVAAVGPLTVPVKPRIDGVDAFGGESYHTARWPRAGADFTGKRVAVIGTGSSGVQVIQEAAKTAAQLTVYQRTATYCTPLNNSPIDPQTQAQIKERHDEIFEICSRSNNGFLHTADPRSALEVSEEERLAFFERQYATRGVALWHGNFRDIHSDRRANALVSEFVKNKIRARVRDPKVAAMLTPKDHGFAAKRVPLETGYYEVFNQPNVLLIDLRENPIQRITSRGIETMDGERPFDMIVYATGFDAILGSFDNIDIRGLDGLRLIDKWKGGPRSFLGMMIAGFPNFFTPAGPLSCIGNVPRNLDYNTDWMIRLITYMREHQLVYADVRPDAEDAWVAHSNEVAVGSLSADVDSWYTGVNTNLEGRNKRMMVYYRGTLPAYRQRCEAVIAGGYRELILGSRG